MADILQVPGATLGVLAAAALFWYLGLHQPFLLTLAALAIGGPAGYGVEMAIGRAMSRRVKTDTSRR